MPLSQGTRLGPYEIVSPLGAGGMGEVYRARDTKLNREVALKVLPEAFAADPERMARFEREAQVLASLNHPNIAAIYGLEESGSTRALVMELVEGPTLGQLVETRNSKSETRKLGSSAAASFDFRSSNFDPLAVAKQIADAFEYAHEHNIIHRDLKPANVKVKADGVVKVLDFGLAKALENPLSPVPSPASGRGWPGGSGEGQNSPTLSLSGQAGVPPTRAGMILGTAAYMSPEQAKGLAVDRRTDIWAFGCVLYEMLAGASAFKRETLTETIVAVLKEEPDWSAIPSSTPPTIQKLVRRCLKKDLRQRLQAIGEARIAIEETLSGSPSPPAPLPQGEGGPAERERVRVTPLPHALPWALAGLLLGGLIAGLLVWKFGAPAPQRSAVLSYILPPPGTTFRGFSLGAGTVAVSPDGKQLAFSATDENGVTKLYVRPLDSNEAKAIAGTEDAAMPFWSPDGGSLGFFADQKLKAVNLANGNVQTLADVSTVTSGGAWSPSGTILFKPQSLGPLNEISSSGGKPRPVTKLEPGDIGDGSPAFLPDGRHFLYESYDPIGPLAIWLGELGSSEKKLVLKAAGSPAFASGYLLFLRGNRIFAQRLDPSTGRLSGEATALGEAQAYSVSSSRVLALQGGAPLERPEWFDRSGYLLDSVGPVATYMSATISPDGKRVLVDALDPKLQWTDLWSYPAAGGVGTRLTFGPAYRAFSVWSPDGKYIAYSRFQLGGEWEICRKPADGSGEEEKLFTLGGGIYRPQTPQTGAAWGRVVDWSPDGRYISFDQFDIKSSRYEFRVLPLAGDRKPFPVAAVNAPEFGGLFSPDGRWLAYISYETGRPEVYVAPFPGPGGKFQISQNGGWSCRWDQKGRLYFLSIGNRLMEADLDTQGKSLQVKAIDPLFRLSLTSIGYTRYERFDVNADGSRFLVITSTDPNASRSIGLLLNWQSKLKGKE